MKDTTKTIIIGVTITLLVLILTIFILYKADSKKIKDENTTNKNNYNNTRPTDKNNNNSNNENNSPSNNTEVNTTIKDDEKNDKIILYMFHSSTCSHCIKAIETMKNERNTTFKNVEIRTFMVNKNQVNSELYQKVTAKLQVNTKYVPYFVIGEYNRVGFDTEILLKEYKKALNNKNYRDIVSEVIKENKDLKPVYETI
ncbi:MAG: hypothetical protein HFI49_01500 [Bacilli bacterium]|jgi:glutaredoxin|nr:hypothetical protein [Bacilli bacterium]